MTFHRLQIVQSGRTTCKSNHLLQHAQHYVHLIRYDKGGHNKTCILYFGSSYFVSQMQPIFTSQLMSSGLCLSATNTSNPTDQPFIRTLSFHQETASSTTINLSQLIPWGDTYTTSLFLESTFIPLCANSLPRRGSWFAFSFTSCEADSFPLRRN